MLIIGFDAAAQWKKFGYAIGRYSDGRVTVETAGLLGNKNEFADKVASRLQSATNALVAIDAPLGWPKTLGESLSNHKAGDFLLPSPNQLFRRKTDDHVHALIGKRPLDVGADRIARATWSALDVLNRLRNITTQAIPLLVWPWDKRGLAAIEVYPAATLITHGINASGYKGKEGLEVRNRIAKQLEPRITGIASNAEKSDDVFDACLCLLAAMDFIENCTPPPEDVELARKEGWIWVRRS